MLKKIVLFVPISVFVAFLMFILRAKYAFGQWPRMSHRDPHFLSENIHGDFFSPFFSYDFHYALVCYLFVVSIFALPFMFFGLRKILLNI